MKEVLTKKFWRDMKQIFDEARAETPAAESATPATPEQSKPGAPEPPDASVELPLADSNEVHNKSAGFDTSE